MRSDFVTTCGGSEAVLEEIIGADSVELLRELLLKERIAPVTVSDHFSMECDVVRLTPKFSCKQVNKNAWQSHAQPLDRLSAATFVR